MLVPLDDHTAPAPATTPATDPRPALLRASAAVGRLAATTPTDPALVGRLVAIWQDLHGDDVPAVPAAIDIAPGLIPVVVDVAHALDPDVLRTFTDGTRGDGDVSLVLVPTEPLDQATCDALFVALQDAGLVGLPGGPDVLLLPEPPSAEVLDGLALAAAARLVPDPAVATPPTPGFGPDESEALGVLLTLRRRRYGSIRSLGPDDAFGSRQEWPLVSPGAVELGRATYHTAARLTAFYPDDRVVVGPYTSIGPEAVIQAGGSRGHDVGAPSLFPFALHLLSPTELAASGVDLAPAGGPETTAVGSDVWIGFRAMVCGGVQVGHGAVIAAGAVVFKDVPPYAIVAGNPARVLRYRFSEDVIAALLRIAWWDWHPELIRERLAWFARPITEFCAAFDPALTTEEDGHAAA